MSQFQARIIAAHGSHFLLLSDDGAEQVAVTRGRRQDMVVGDLVCARLTGENSAVIESRTQRRNQLTRSDRFKSKTLAANIDQAAFVIAGNPPFSEELLLRVHLAAAFEGIEFAVVANKLDLSESHQALQPRLSPLRALGVRVFETSARAEQDQGLQRFSEWLGGKTSLLLGQSGMGKSTLLNRLVPHAEMRTREISERLHSGKHTTTFSRLFELAGSTAIIDTPGFQQFGLEHLSESQLRYGALEFRCDLHRCRFSNCRHLDEPGCGIRTQVDAGQIDAQRYRYFRTVLLEAGRPRTF